MVEEYILYKSFCYASEYIKQINNAPVAMIWDDKRDEKKREGEIIETNKKKIMIKSKCRIIIFSNY